jgi:hypothetical protein
VHSDPTDVIAADLALAGVQPRAQMDAERSHRSAAKTVELRSNNGIMRIKQRTPVTVADLRRRHVESTMSVNNTVIAVWLSDPHRHEANQAQRRRESRHYPYCRNCRTPPSNPFVPTGDGPSRRPASRRQGMRERRPPSESRQEPSAETVDAPHHDVNHWSN